jgi:hypothetical protein
MKRTTILLTVLATLGIAVRVAAAGAVSRDNGPQSIVPRPIGVLDVQVWVDRGEASHYRIGDPIEVFFRTNRDAHVVIYDVDTEGYVNILFPARPGDRGFVRAGVTYRLPVHGRRFEYAVAGPPGIEVVEAVATSAPFRSLEPFCDRYGVGWGARRGARAIKGSQGLERLRSRLIERRYPREQVASDRTWFHVVPYRGHRRFSFGLSGRVFVDGLWTYDRVREDCREESVAYAPGMKTRVRQDRRDREVVRTRSSSEAASRVRVREPSSKKVSGTKARGATASRKKEVRAPARR